MKRVKHSLGVFLRSLASSLHFISLAEVGCHLSLKGRWQKTASTQTGRWSWYILYKWEPAFASYCRPETIYVDGTFEISPRLFYQVFTVNAFVHGQQFPVYGLLPGKSRGVYKKFFIVVKEAALKCGVCFSSDEIISWPWFNCWNLNFQEQVSMGATSNAPGGKCRDLGGWKNIRRI